MTDLLPILLLGLLGLLAFVILRLRNLLAAVLLTGLYSLTSAAFFVVLDAVDVAFTEASVGAGISTVLMLGGLLATTRHEKGRGRAGWLPAVVAAITGCVLLYSFAAAPAFGDAAAPIHHHVAPYYLEHTGPEIGVPNVVTALLASYRGYDTMGETTVIFTAGIGVLALLGLKPRRRKADDDPPTPRPSPREPR